MLDAGDISYSVNLQTAELLRAERVLGDSTRRTERNFGRVEKSSNRLNTSLTRLATAVSAAISVRQVTAYADAWTNVQNQLRVVTDSQRDLEEVTQRIVDITRDTRASLEGTSQLYSRFRRGVDETIISDERLLGVTETINQTLAVSGATASEAENALRQLAQGLAAGALRGEEFNSVSEQAPGILRAVSQETGKTIGELRDFAAEGGITSELLIKALENYAETAEREFGGATRSMSGALEVARTNVIEYVGRTNALTDAVSASGDAIVFLSENLETLTTVAAAGATVYGARLVGALAESTKEYMVNSAATIKSTTASANAARTKMTEIAAEIEFLRVTQASLATQLKQAGATKQASVLRAQLAANTAALTTATKSYAAAQAQANLAARAGNAALKGLRGGMALLGGPAGVVFLAAAALVYFTSKAEDASERSARLKDEVDGLISSFEDMDRAANIRQLENFEEQAQDAKDRLSEIDAEIKQIQATARQQTQMGDQSANIRALQAIAKLQDEAQELTDDMRVAQGAAFELQKRLYGIAEGGDPFEVPTSGVEDLGEAAARALSPVQAVMDQINREYRGIRPGDDPFEEINNEDTSTGSDEPEGPRDPGSIGLNSLQQLEERTRQEMQILQESYEEKELSEIEFQERMAEVGRQYSEQRMNLMNEEKQGFIGSLEEMGVSFQSLQNQAAGALTNVALGFQSGSEAAKDFARTAITQVIGAIVRMGIQSLVSQRVVEASSAANAATLSGLYATPAALASLASFGSNAIPAQAGIATTIATTQGLALGTGRLNGGPVQSDRLYPFEEDGEPEVLVQNGKSYLRPGSAGEVISNKELTGGKGGDNINMGGVNMNIYGKMGSREIRDALYDSGPELYTVMKREFAKRGRKF